MKTKIIAIVFILCIILSGCTGKNTANVAETPPNNVSQESSAESSPSLESTEKSDDNMGNNTDSADKPLVTEKEEAKPEIVETEFIRNNSLFGRAIAFVKIPEDTAEDYMVTVHFMFGNADKQPIYSKDATAYNCGAGEVIIVNTLISIDDIKGAETYGATLSSEKIDNTLLGFSLRLSGTEGYNYGPDTLAERANINGKNVVYPVVVLSGESMNAVYGTNIFNDYNWCLDVDITVLFYKGDELVDIQTSFDYELKPGEQKFVTYTADVDFDSIKIYEHRVLKEVFR